MFRVLRRAAEVFQFLLHQEAGHSHGQLMCDAFDAGVRAVRRAERVADIHFAKHGEFLGKFRIVLFLFLWKRTFSSSSTSPGFRAFAIASTSEPTQSGAICTGLPATSPTLPTQASG